MQTISSLENGILFSTEIADEFIRRSKESGVDKIAVATYVINDHENKYTRTIKIGALSKTAGISTLYKLSMDLIRYIQAEHQTNYIYDFTIKLDEKIFTYKDYLKLKQLLDSQGLPETTEIQTNH
jgi:hypothetical protein